MLSYKTSTSTLYPPSNDDVSINSRTPFDLKDEEASRLSRTPSPTPSEAKELESGPVDWKRLLTRKFWFRREWICTLSSSSSSKVDDWVYWMDPGYYVILTVILVITTLIVLFHKQIVTWLTPVAIWLYEYVHFIHLPTTVPNVINFQPQSRLASSNCHIVRYIVSSGKKILLAISFVYCQCWYLFSCLGMKSSPFYVVLSGDFGLVLPSSQLVHYLAKLATFSMLIRSNHICSIYWYILQRL